MIDATPATGRFHHPRANLELAQLGQRVVLSPLRDGGSGGIEEAGHLGVGLDAEDLAGLALGDGVVHAPSLAVSAITSRGLSAVRQATKRADPLSWLMDRSPISQRLATALDAAGMSQAQLARAVDTTTATVANWMNDKVTVEHAKADMLFRMARALRIRPEWLLYGEGQEVAAPSPSSDQAAVSQPVKPDVLTIALQLTAEVLEERGKHFTPAQHAEFVSTLYELLEEGMPEAKVLRFARAAAA